MSPSESDPAADARSGSRDLLSELLGIQAERQSCVVIVTADGTEAKLHFEEGTLVYAEDGLTGKALGRLLVEEGKITEGQLASLLDALSEAGERGSSVRLGDLAVSRGLLSRKELSLALFSQVRKRVVSALSWESPQIVVESDLGTERSRERARFPTTLEPLVLSAFRKLPRAALAARLEPLRKAGLRAAMTVEDLDAVLTLFRPKAEEREVLTRVLAEAETGATAALSEATETGAVDEGLGFLAVLVATGRLRAPLDENHGPVSHRKRPRQARFCLCEGAARPQLLRTAKLQLFAPIRRQQVTEDAQDEREQPASSPFPSPGSPTAKLRGERAFLAGKLHMAKGREALAKSEFWRAHRLVPAAAEYELYLGWLTLRNDERRAAELESVALRAKRQDPELGFASYVLAHLALLRGDVDRAEAEQLRAQRLGVRGAPSLPQSLALPSAKTEVPPSEGTFTPRPTVRPRERRMLPFRARSEAKKAASSSSLTNAAPPSGLRRDPLLAPAEADANATLTEATLQTDLQATAVMPVAEASQLDGAVDTESRPTGDSVDQASLSGAPSSSDETITAAPAGESSTDAPASGRALVSDSKVAPTSMEASTVTPPAEDALEARDERAPAKVATTEAITVEPVATSDAAPTAGVPDAPNEPETQLAAASDADGPSSEPPPSSQVSLSSTVMTPSRAPLYAVLGFVVMLVVGVIVLRSPSPVTPVDHKPEASTTAMSPTVVTPDARIATSDAPTSDSAAAAQDAEITSEAQAGDSSPAGDGASSSEAGADPGDTGPSTDSGPRTERAKTGELVPEGAPSGHRVFVDGLAKGQTPATITAPCGPHEVRVGSKGTARTVNIPCGGSIVVRP